MLVGFVCVDFEFAREGTTVDVIDAGKGVGGAEVGGGEVDGAGVGGAGVGAGTNANSVAFANSHVVTVTSGNTSFCNSLKPRGKTSSGRPRAMVNAPPDLKLNVVTTRRNSSASSKSYVISVGAPATP